MKELTRMTTKMPPITRRRNEEQEGEEGDDSAAAVLGHEPSLPVSFPQNPQLAAGSIPPIFQQFCSRNHAVVQKISFWGSAL